MGWNTVDTENTDLRGFIPAGNMNPVLINLTSKKHNKSYPFIKNQWLSRGNHGFTRIYYSGNGNGV
jgi:hypothetical protein